MLVIAVVAVAYGSAAPQLGVAEFAPAARSQVDAPPTTAGDTSAASGRGQGGRRASSTTTVPASTSTMIDGSSAASPTTKVSRSRACFGDPPRQTEDPMAPPCMAAIFDGDNGGTTSRGVSATEIRVAVPIWGVDAASTATVAALFEHVNQRFELYGRRLVPVSFAGSASTPLAARAMAADLAGQGIFASLTGLQEVYDAHVTLPVEFARQKVVTITRGAGVAWADRTLYDAWHPYVWSAYPSAEDIQVNLASFTCTALAGRLAQRAGDESLRTKVRRFGIVAASSQLAPQATVLAQGLADCTGVAPLRAEATSSSPMRTTVERLRDAGATTLLCVCEDQNTASVMSTAHSAGFHPEWVITPWTYFGCEHECEMQSLRRSSAAAPPIMLNAGPRLLPVQARLWFSQLQPVLEMPGMAASMVLGLADLLYSELLVLATGVQGAGPTLTPDTFAQALMTTQFSNPGAGQAPYWQPSAGFGPGDHSFYDDFSVAWWSDGAEAFEVSQGATAKGSWCYLDQAARFSVGTYPADAETRLFNPDLPCR